MRWWLFPLVLASCGSEEPVSISQLPAFKVGSVRREALEWLAVKDAQGDGTPRAYIRRETLRLPEGGSAKVDTVYDAQFHEKGKIGADGRLLVNRKNRRTQEWEEVDTGRHSLARAVGMVMDWPLEADKDFSVVPMTVQDTQAR